MTDSITSWYIATVWMAVVDSSYDPGTRQVVRLQAIGPDDFCARVRACWPNKVITIGPVSLSKVQR
jgi:hypothetical protein